MSPTLHQLQWNWLPSCWGKFAYRHNKHFMVHLDLFNKVTYSTTLGAAHVPSVWWDFEQPRSSPQWSHRAAGSYSHCAPNTSSQHCIGRMQATIAHQYIIKHRQIDLTCVAVYAIAWGVTFDIRNVAATGFRAGFLRFTLQRVMLDQSSSFSASSSSTTDTSLADAGDVKICLNV